MSKYRTNNDLKYAIGADPSNFVKNFDLVNLKSNFDKLDFDKLETTPVDLSKVSNIVKKTTFEELVNKLNDIQTINFSDLVKKAGHGTKVEEIEKKIPSIINVLLMMKIVKIYAENLKKEN